MKIQDNEILGSFFIEVEPEQFILKETVSIDTTHRLSKGEEGEREVIHGYFVDMGHLIKKLVQTKISRNEQPITLQQFWQSWVSYSKKITSLVDNDIYQWKEETNKRIERIEQRLNESLSTNNTTT